MKYLSHLYCSLTLFYFIVSLSFVYLSQIGNGLYAAMFGAVIAIVAKKHFVAQYRRVHHMTLVKNLVVVDGAS